MQTALIYNSGYFADSFAEHMAPIVGLNVTQVIPYQLHPDFGTAVRESDFIVADLLLPERNGAKRLLRTNHIAKIRGLNPAARLFVISEQHVPRFAHWSVEQGADGYYSTKEPADELRLRLEALMDDRCGVPQSVLDYDRTSDPCDVSRLSGRPLDVFIRLGVGMSIPEIAYSLGGLHQRTVESHRRVAKEKLGLDSVDELLAYAIEWQQGYW